MKVVRVSIFIFLTIAALVVYQCRRLVFDNSELSEVVNVFVPKGSGVSKVAEILSVGGVIKHPLLFKIMARLSGLDKNLKAGEYQFEPHISMWQVMQKIANGEVFYRRITLPEGLTTGQYLYIIASNPDFTGEISENVKEGEMLPETYSFEYGSSRDSLIIQAKTAMQKAKNEIWQSRNSDIQIKNPEEMMVLASIIEKETSVPEERGLVSSVFMNRLKKGMRLQTDPTVIYALTEGEFELKRPLTRADLTVDSPYNTYKNYGLPPKPICNPGRDAIEAAVHPEKSDFLYFVADGKGGHSFARSLKEHNKNVFQWKKSKK